MYQKENWEKILLLRESAAKGDPMSIEQMQRPDKTASVGTCFGLGLIRLRYAANETDPKAFSYATDAIAEASSRYSSATKYHHDQKKAMMGLWLSRCQLIYLDKESNWGYNIVIELQWLKRPQEAFLDFAFADRIPADSRALVEQQIRANLAPTYLYLDNKKVSFQDVQPEVVNGRTMVSAVPVAQRLGADVHYDEETGRVMMIRGGHTITMTPGKTTAYKDGQAIEMDVAPENIGGYTVVPIRYLCEWFGQTVNWDVAKGGVVVMEDKAVASPSNLEAWALPMGAVLSDLDLGDATWFGLWPRGLTLSGGSGYVQGMPSPVGQARMILDQSWGIQERSQLIRTADAVSRQQTGNVSCFDLFRMSNLAQLGYLGGFLTYEEALAMVEPSAKRCRETFTSWEEFYENYLDGYNWWARNDVLGKDPWTVTRGTFCKELFERHREVLDEDLFKQSVKGVPGLTAEALLKSVS